MRWSLVAVRICIIIVTLIAVAIILLTTVPLATGGLDFDLPDDEDNSDFWSMEGNTVHAELPIGIYNGGYFDIEDFDFLLNLTDTDGFPLAESQSDRTDLKAGEWTEVVVSLSFDLDDLPPEKQFKIVFNGTEAIMGIGLDAKFGLKTMSISITIDPDDATIEIPPMITEMEVDPSQLQLVDTGSRYELVLPYSFSASDMIADRELILFMSISNETQYIGDDTTVIAVQQQNQGQLTFPIGQEMYDHLLAETDTFTVSTVVTFLGISMGQEFTYHWSPFFSNFDVQYVNVYYVYNTGADGQLELRYSFDAASSIQGKYVSIDMTIIDSVGNVASG
ncbi:MAG: hypothetical protein LLG16_04080, partial [Euryarchaeota archaeon]|nr:hypothetical protein [Euryarchaeota archaeon]